MHCVKPLPVRETPQLIELSSMGVSSPKKNYYW